MTTQEIITPHNEGADRQTYWANRINGHLRKSVEEIIQAGLDLIEAREELGPLGKFTAMVVGQLRVTLRTAEMLMKVASHPVLSDPNHGSALPISWRTLSELARLPAPTVEAGIADHSIHPEMQRKDVARLVPPVVRDVLRERKMAAKHKAKMEPIDRLKEEHQCEIEERQREIDDLQERLTSAEARGLFDEGDTAEHIADLIILAAGEDKAKEIATAILQRFKKKRGRPAKAGKADEAI